MEAKALVDMLDVTLSEADAETLRDNLCDVENLAPVDTLVHTREEVEADTVDNTLVDLKAEALINKLAMTL